MSALVLVQQTESFAQLWVSLAGEAGLTLRAVASVAEAGDVPDAAAVILSVAGAEEAAEDLVLRAVAASRAPCAVVGASTEHRLALELVRAGAAEYFALPGDLAALRGWVADRGRAAVQRAAAASLADAEREDFDFRRILGRSRALHAALDVAARIIPRGRATVLITGETGTGKELLAHAIHYNGPRRAHPFVEINCAAIPAGLLESELFGYEKGAFTDARTAKPGLFEAADGGTLFLDEIGELPLELQGKVLKVLEEKRVRRLGSVRAAPVDVRIIAATHVELAAAVARREFREDLYYRLAVIPIHLPPLRDRGDDVLLLAEHFLAAAAEEYDLPVPRLEPEARDAILAHSWPGNVRELRNSMERALLLGGGEVRLAHLFPGGVPAEGGARGPLPFPATMHEIERAAARAMTELLDGNKKAAADALEISRSRLYRLLDPEGV